MRSTLTLQNLGLYIWTSFPISPVPHMLKNRILRAIAACLPLIVTTVLSAQCTTSNGTGCQCEQSGQTNCDLLPDITISWSALANYAGGPNEYSQNDASNPGRLRVTGSTPNIGHGALNVRGVDQNGYRWFLCGTDTIPVYDPQSDSTFTCPNIQQTAKQLIMQRVYHKNGSAMTFTERFAGTMTYHPTHGHNHVDDWATFTLRSQTTDPNPLNWPIIGTGAKVGFCLMDYYSCSNSSANGHCRTSQEYQGGTALTSTGQFPNYGHGGGQYNCSTISQGISVGYTDVYSESLDGMWVNIPPGTCNGNYWVVMEVDPNNNFIEENDDNNWTAAPVTLTLQTPAGGDFAQITANGPTSFCDGGSVQLTATPGLSYQWSNGATTQSITVAQSASLSCTVTGMCGTDQTPEVAVTSNTTMPPTGTGATLQGPGTATLGATGSNVHWYDQAVGGTWQGSGNSFQTPVITSTTHYYAEDHVTLLPGSQYTGKLNNTGSGNYGNYAQYLIFDALAPFTLKSVKVYANSAGNRTFQVLSSTGTVLAQVTVNLPTGESRATLNLSVPQGTNLRLSVTATLQNLYRNSGGVSYPYTIQDLVSVKNSSAGTQYYYYCYDWEVQGTSTTCTSTRTQVTATVNQSVALSARVRLEGPYDTGSGLMRDDLRTGGLLPLQEPYTGLGFPQAAGGGGETTVVGTWSMTGNDAVVDWIRVELRSSAAPGIIVATRQGLLQRDGDIVATDGVSPLVFGVGAGNYHVAVRHRNHLGVMSASALALGSLSTDLDLSSPATGVWGVEARKTQGAIMLLWTGNAVADNELKYTGSNNDRDPILQAVGSTTPANVVAGYHLMDVNLDGLVKYTGSANDRDPILVGVGSTTPNNVRGEQLP
jgi:Ig-like domain CHU_C associated/Lysyl oxidase